MGIRSKNGASFSAVTIPAKARAVSGFIRVALGALVRNRWRLLPKAANFVLVWFQKRVLRPARVLGLPYYANIDTGNICNLRCPLCPAGTRKEGRPAGLMSFADFKRIVDELERSLVIIDLYNWGEPFLNKDVFRMIEYAHARGIIVKVSSNLNSLSSDGVRRLAASGCDFLLVSLYGASQESCERYQVGTRYDRVIRTMRRIMRARRNTPVVVWRYLVHRHNEREIGRAREEARGTADVLEFNFLRSDMAEELLLDERGQFENLEPWLPADEAWSMYTRGGKRKRAPHGRCAFLYSHTVINWNGSVSPCCSVWHEKYDFGNALRASFRAVWNNDSFRDSRKLIFQGRPGPRAGICAICKKNRAYR